MHEKRFLLITSFMLILIGAPAVMSVVREPVLVLEESAGATGVGATASSAVAGGQARGVASARSPSPSQTLKSESTHRNAIQSRSVVMEYECKKLRDAEVDGTLLRLKGQDETCLNEKWTDISITNHSNGFTAAVIFLKKGFTTDFIDLKEGDNNLEIQAKDDKGQTITKKFTVKRRSIASVEDSK